MAVKSKDDIIAQLSAKIGGDTSDDAIALMEDVTDTLNDLSDKVAGDGKDWKAEAERIDKEWREKYAARFTSASSKEDDKQDDKGGEEKDYTFENLFKEGDK